MANWKSPYREGSSETYAEHFFGGTNETFLKALFGEDLTNPNVNIEHISEPLNNVTNLDQFLNNPNNNNFLTQYKNITYTLAKAFPELAFAIRGHKPEHLLIFGRISARDGSIDNRIGSLFYGKINNTGDIIKIEIDKQSIGNNQFFFRHFDIKKAKESNDPIRGLDPPIKFDFNSNNEVIFDENNQIIKDISQRYEELLTQNQRNFHTQNYPNISNVPFYPSNCLSMRNGVKENGPKPNGETKNTMQPLNQILYGPPGTGKTYKTAELAVKICESDFSSSGSDTEKRKAIMEKYKSLVESGRISFVTFHQSYGYEEFVEGLRPILSPDKTVQTGQDDTDQNPQDEPVQSPQGNTDQSPQEAKPESGEVKYHINPGIFKAMCERASENTEQKFVLIIDEINRGNISKIFGELITLIEEDKRKGKREGKEQVDSLTVTLPYSQKSFSVPINLYLIGTMNTADRSLALLDTALRRRFDFIEMMPEDGLLNDLTIKVKDSKEVIINIQKLLKKINDRIEVLYDREHKIGHAFFTSLLNKEFDEKKKFEELQRIFKNKVIPLLEEYFFDDWQKIEMVLGSDFFKPDESDKPESEKDKLFENNDDTYDLNNKKIYKLNLKALSNPNSYTNIYK